MFSADLGGVTTASDPSDPYFSNTVLLLHGDGTNGATNNQYTDSSSSALTFTRGAGNMGPGSFSPFPVAAGTAYSPSVNGGSLVCSSGYINAASSNAFTFGTGDFTIEAWIYPLATGNREIICMRDVANLVYSNRVRISSTNAIEWSNGSVWRTSTTTVSLNAWSHFAIVRISGTLTMYINGAAAGSFADTTDVASNRPCYIGYADDTTSGYFSGYISNIRVVKGTGVYTGAFTPPTAPLTAVSGTTLLMKFDDGAIYDSTAKNCLSYTGSINLNTTVKKYGTASIDCPASSYIRIENKTDLLLSTTPFTIEMFVYFTSSAASSIIGKGASITGWYLSKSATNNIVFTDGSTAAITSSNTVALNTWYHIAVVREGIGAGQTKLYIDGVNVGSGTVATNYSGQIQPIQIGSSRSAGSPYLSGYIDELRITKNVARYTADFTPPTQAFLDK